jgi:proton-translocating NADH-quinone oxidoreductase chain N
VLALLVLVPLAVLLFLNLPWRGSLRSVHTTSVLALTFAEIVTAIALPTLLETVEVPFLSELRFGLGADDLTRVLLASIGVVVGAAMLVGQESISDERQQRHFASLLIISLTGMNATVLLRDFFSLYVFLEVTSVASFVLIAMERGLAAVEGAFRYLILSAVATALMLGAAGLMLLSAGGTGFEAVRSGIAGGANLSRSALCIFMLGLFIKGGVVPFHGWLPGAYSASPPAVSVLLSGIVTKASGIYALIRIAWSVYVPDQRLSMVLLVAGTVSIVVGAVAAMGQTDLKRMFAYSSISQVGYIVLALGAGNELGIVAATFHLFNHSIFKSLLFVDSAAIESRLGTTDMARMGGLGGKMPLTGATTTIAMLSAAGIPPFAGFWSKLLIIVALWQSAHVGFAVVAVLASLLTLGYFLVMQRQAFFGKPSSDVVALSSGGVLGEVKYGYMVPAVLLALVTVLAGVSFPFLLDSSLSFLLLSKTLPW